MPTIIAFLLARWAEPTTKACLIASVSAFFGALTQGVSPCTAGLALLVGAVGALVPEAKPVLTDLQALAESTPITNSTAAKAGALLLAVMALGSVSACSTLTPSEVKLIQVACQVDGQLQPVAVTLADELVPAVAPLVATDQALVHPAVVAACANVAAGAKPVAVTGVPKSSS